MTKNQADVSQIFLVYMALVGDVDKTAVALDLEPKFVRKLAEQEGWAEKVARMSLASKGSTPGDYERTQNRAVNYVQAHLLRRAIDAQLVIIANTEAADLMKITDKDGNTRYSARVFTDLASTMQKVHEMTYSALGDSVKERTTEAPKDGPSQQGIHASMLSLLNKTGVPLDTVPRTLSDGANELVARLRDQLPAGAEVIDIPENVSHA